MKYAVKNKTTGLYFEKLILATIYQDNVAYRWSDTLTADSELCLPDASAVLIELCTIFKNIEIVAIKRVAYRLTDPPVCKKQGGLTIMDVDDITRWVEVEE